MRARWSRRRSHRCRLHGAAGAGRRSRTRLLRTAARRRKARERSWVSCLKSTSCRELAREVLERSIAGEPPRELPRALVAESCGPALFGVLVEGLADRFEPALCDTYARLFSQAIGWVRNDFHPALLVARYERVRRV